jgi:hypothetical protein
LVQQNQEASVKDELDAVLNRGKIRFELLWAFFEPFDDLYLHCPHTNVPMCVTYQGGEQGKDDHHQPCFSIISHYLSRSKDGQPGYAMRRTIIPHFWGEKEVKELNIYPLAYEQREMFVPILHTFSQQQQLCNHNNVVSTPKEIDFNPPNNSQNNISIFDSSFNEHVSFDWQTMCTQGHHAPYLWI